MMLSEQLLDRIAQELAGLVDIPYVPEWGEREIAVRVIKVVEAVLVDIMPPEWVAYIEDATQGFESGDMDKFTAEIADMINSELNIPGLSEEVEQVLINSTIGLLMEAVQKGRQI